MPTLSLFSIEDLLQSSIVFRSRLVREDSDTTRERNFNFNSIFICVEWPNMAGFPPLFCLYRIQSSCRNLLTKSPFSKIWWIARGNHIWFATSHYRCKKLENASVWIFRTWRRFCQVKRLGILHQVIATIPENTGHSKATYWYICWNSWPPIFIPGSFIEFHLSSLAGFSSFLVSSLVANLLLIQFWWIYLKKISGIHRTMQSIEFYTPDFSVCWETQKFWDFVLMVAMVKLWCRLLV